MKLFITPLSLAVITRLLAEYGNKVVAGFGAASRIEMMALIIPMSLATAMTPLAGQNWGAGKIDRILKGQHFTSILSLIWGAFVFILALIFAPAVISRFNSDPGVIEAGASYLRIVAVSYGGVGIINLTTQAFSALRRPFDSAAITLLKAFALNLPLAFIGSRFFGERGIFTATLITNGITAVVAFVYLRHFLKKHYLLSKESDNNK